MSKPIYFAPIQGFTESAYRRAHRQIAGGVSNYCSPFLRFEHGQVRKKDLRDIGHEDQKDILIPQIIAADTDEMRPLCEAIIQKGYRDIDINMGCPFPMQTHHGRGTGLLERPEAVRKILEEVRRITESSDVRFSVKMRLGNKSPEECLAILPLLNDSPIVHITMHPRLGIQQYKGEMDMDGFEKFLQASGKPVIFNGNIATVEDIARIESAYPDLKGIMIGRGLLERPTLAREYSTGEILSDDQVRDCILRIHAEVLSEYENTLEGGEGQILQKIQPFWDYPSPYFDKKFIKHVTKTRALGAYRKIIEEYSYSL